MKAQKNYSIRDRLFYSFFLTAGLMCIMVLYSFISINSIALSITSAYKTNVTLNEYQTVLGRVEASMESYISFHTFESIESYYSWRGKLDTLAVKFNVTLSDDPILLLEYKVKKLMESFLEYADKAVYARRGNNVKEYGANYSSALRVYGYLSDSVNQLNALYFQRNITGYNILFQDMMLIEVLSIMILCFVISINFLMVYILINKITGPLVELSRAANKLAAGNFDGDLLEIQAQDEVGNICRAFDRMTVSIREYVDTIRAKAAIENRLRQQEMDMRELYKDAQLKTLQAQINPHFLFNTLNAGAQLAMMEGADNTCTFIEKTADFFRYNIQNQNKDCILPDEIALVDNYMYIMNVRFADRLSYIKDIRCGDLDVPMPSMILQPLVENSIKHGISDMKSGGTITLRIFRDDDILVIEISDNGSGISPELREQLLHDSFFNPENAFDRTNSPSVGIGMTNVITRLRVFFDDDRIFDIRNNDPEPGTTFSIRINNV
jgi:two-component system sensor histidine kinase YesM